MKQYKDIYAFIESAESAMDTDISVHGWEWNFKHHLKRSFYTKHGRLLEGDADNLPVKNITRPILNLQYRAEDIDVKNISLYVDDPDSSHLSFLVRKYHDDVFILENDLDTYIDEVQTNTIDYGVGLSKYIGKARPEAIDMLSIAFCDQTDIMKGPIGFKVYMNPAELKGMEKQGWGKESNGATSTIDELIEQAESSREDGEGHRDNETPTDYIEIYEVHGVMPDMFLDDDEMSTGYSQQFHIVGFYKDKEGKKTGVTLFRKKQSKPTLKPMLRDKIPSRCAGFGGAEELFPNQMYVNRNKIYEDELLEASSKTILKAIGTDLKARYPNGAKDMENLEIIEMNQGEDIGQIDTTPRQMALFNNAVAEWEQHAQMMGSATDPLLGEPAPSGTPFRAQERQVIEGKGLHEYRRGQFAKYWEEVYTEWIIPHIITEITKDQKFLAELSTDEMQFIADRMATNETNKMIKEAILSGELVSKAQVEAYRKAVADGFIKRGNKQFIKILKGEFDKKPIRVKVSISGKQKNLQLMTDKMVNVFRQILANPQGFAEIMKVPEMADTFNSILEYSGISPVLYAGLSRQEAGSPQPAPQGVKPELQGNVGAEVNA